MFVCLIQWNLVRACVRYHTAKTRIEYVNNLDLTRVSTQCRHRFLYASVQLENDSRYLGRPFSFQYTSDIVHIQTNHRHTFCSTKPQAGERRRKNKTKMRRKVTDREGERCIHCASQPHALHICLRVQNLFKVENFRSSYTHTLLPSAHNDNNI